MHESEAEFDDHVIEWFRTEYGEGAVETQHWQPGPDWRPDLIVDCAWCRLFVEIENDADSVRPGLAQAMGYAGADTVAGVPMVVTPAGHLDPTRADRLRTHGVLIREFDAETGSWKR